MVWQLVFRVEAKAHCRQEKIVVVDDVLADEMVNFRVVPELFAVVPFVGDKFYK